MESINKCDIDLRKELLSNIIVCGGNTLSGGFVEKLSNSVYEIAPPVIFSFKKNSKVKLVAYPLPAERKFSAWIGGSILASVTSFQNLWVSKGEYEEHGPSIIDKKCH